MYSEIALNQYTNTHEISNNFINESIKYHLEESYRYITEDEMVMEAMKKDIASTIVEKWKGPMEFFQTMGINYLQIQRMFVDVPLKCLTIVIKNGFSKKTMDLISNTMQEALVDYIKIGSRKVTIDKLAKEANVPKSDRLLQAFFAVQGCVGYNSLFHAIMAAFFPAGVAQYITAVLCAPICEEMFKRIAIKGGYEKEFTIVFNLCEFSLYIKRNEKTKYFVNLVISRLVCVGSHVLYTIIQWLTQNTEILTKWGIDPADHEKVEILGNALTTTMHSLWNAGLSVVFLYPVIKPVIQGGGW